MTAPPSPVWRSVLPALSPFVTWRSVGVADLAAAAREVRGAARAVVERVASAADDARELLAHPLQAGDAQVDLVDLRGHANAQRLGRLARALRRAQVLVDLREREADRLRLLDRAQEADGLLVVAAMPARLARRLGQQSATLVVPERLDVHARAGGDLSDLHASTIDPYLGTEIKRRGSSGHAWWQPPMSKCHALVTQLHGRASRLDLRVVSNGQGWWQPPSQRCAANRAEVAIRRGCGGRARGRGAGRAGARTPARSFASRPTR